MPSPIQQRLCQIMTHIGCLQPRPRGPATSRTGNTTIRPNLRDLFQMNYYPTRTNASLLGALSLASVKLGKNESAGLGQASHGVSSTDGLDTCLTKFPLMFWKASRRPSSSRLCLTFRLSEIIGQEAGASVEGRCRIMVLWDAPPWPFAQKTRKGVVTWSFAPVNRFPSHTLPPSWPWPKHRLEPVYPVGTRVPPRRKMRTCSIRTIGDHANVEHSGWVNAHAVPRQWGMVGRSHQLTALGLTENVH
ncbi:hypothetical protein LY76DRAFT_175567 [Colletotrichum caudatum]|nr:hypothetical protein LY76DRAFT_175567 [Colletotrichum caudatum]